MALDDPTLSHDLRKIVVPSQLMDPVCRLMLELEGRFLREVARLTMTKPLSGDRWVVEREEVLLAAQTILNAAKAEVEKTIGNDDTDTLRRKAS